MGICIMIVGYTTGSFLIAFGLAVLYEFSLEHLQPLQIVYYPAVGTVLLIIGAGVCYGGYMSGRSRPKEIPSK